MGVFFSILTLFLVVVALTNEYFQQKAKVSMMPTVPRVRREIIGLVPDGFSGDIVELGSGWGGMAFALARKFPHSRVYGVEMSPFPFLYTWLRLKLMPGYKNLSFQRRDFFGFELNDIKLVVCYLSNPIMSRLREKFKKELPEGALIVSSTFFIPEWDPEKQHRISGKWDTEIFVYQQRRENAACQT